MRLVPTHLFAPGPLLAVHIKWEGGQLLSPFTDGQFQENSGSMGTMVVPPLGTFQSLAIVLPQKADAIGKQRTSPQFLNRTAKAQRVCWSPKPQEAGLSGSHPPHMPSARYHLLQSQEFLGQLTSISKHPILIQHRLGFGEVSL